MATTFHLIPLPVWEEQRSRTLYEPEAFASDGFIHCTDGLDNLIAVGNRYYTEDPRAFLCLTVDLDLISAEVRYDDPAQIYPHIYGLMETAAVVDFRPVQRSTDGQFVAVT